MPSAAQLERQAAIATTLEKHGAAADQEWFDRQFHALALEMWGEEPRWVREGYELTVTDLFCGAGGSSSGLESVPGIRVVMAANHWKLAIETHQYNFPHVDHDTQDIAKVDPGRFPKTDILWASPACTFWSQARGEKQDFAQQEQEPTLFDLEDRDDEDDEPLPDEAKERSRALMQDIPRFAEYHRYRAVIVENTPPLLKWVHFKKWIARMRALDYEYEVLTLNSAFAHQLGAPAPQLRDRVYIVFWQKRYKRPDFQRWTRPRAWCPTCDEVVTGMYVPKNEKRKYGAYNKQYVFRCPSVTCRNGVVAPFTLPALAALDTSDPGERIGDRKKALSEKTAARIRGWLEKNPLPLASELAGGAAVTTTLARLHGRHSSGASSALVPVEGRDGKAAQSTLQPARTQTGRHETGLLVPAGGTWNDDATSVDVPMRARTTRENEALVIVPLRNNNVTKGTGEPLDTFAAGGNHHALVASVMRNNSQSVLAYGDGTLSWNPDYLFAYDANRVRSTREPLPTQTTVEGDAWLQLEMLYENCRFRMLTVDEVKLGMAFAAGFVLLGSSKRAKVKMCGNAVTPPVSRDLVAAVAEAITGNEIAV